jgi:4'-phosphopantetheinyl transferase
MASRYRLDRLDVHVWLLNLDLPPGALREAGMLLAPDEQTRAGRFVLPEGVRRYTAARGQLRQILGAYLDATPTTIRLGYTQQGKPFLAEPRQALCFNLAHSHELGVVALAQRAAVGIDVEFATRRVDMQAIAGRYFALGEVLQLNSLASADRPAAFLRCWTRKEAILKARGDGLMLPLDSYEVSLLPGEPPRIVRVSPEIKPGDWSLFDVDVPDGYTAALAVEGLGWRLVQPGVWAAAA